MTLRKLSEAIILQAVSDLWLEGERNNSLKFLSSEDFTTCAECAGMSLPDQVKLLCMVREAVKWQEKTKRI